VGQTDGESKGILQVGWAAEKVPDEWAFNCEVGDEVGCNVVGDALADEVTEKQK